jgi:hypothetical protein
MNKQGIVTGLFVGSLLVASCALPTAPVSSPTIPATAGAEATPSTDDTPTGEVISETTTTSAITATDGITPTVGVTTTAGTTQDATPAIVAAANAFLETLSDTEREAVLFDWTDTEQKQRWSNLPEGLYERAGLMWGNMSEPQQTAWLALMQATLSTEGYNRVLAAWNGDDVLAAEQESGGTGGAPPSPPSGTPPGDGSEDDDEGPGAGGPGGGPGGLLFGKQYYWVALIGTPSETEPWQWQWGGHHITINATVVSSEIALTPSFIGCQPCEYTDASGNTVRPLGDIEDDAFALVNSLDATQQEAAILGDTTIDLVLGPGQEGRTIQSEGLPAAQMTADQQAALLQLISHYTGLVNDEDAASRMDEIESTLDETYLAWYGPTTEGEAAYFRVTGPTLVIEYSPQGGGGTGTGLGGDATNLHIHGVYRDPTNDYGAKLTQ